MTYLFIWLHIIWFSIISYHTGKCLIFCYMEKLGNIFGHLFLYCKKCYGVFVWLLCYINVLVFYWLKKSGQSEVLSCNSVMHKQCKHVRILDSLLLYAVYVCMCVSRGLGIFFQSSVWYIQDNWRFKVSVYVCVFVYSVWMCACMWDSVCTYAECVYVCFAGHQGAWGGWTHHSDSWESSGRHHRGEQLCLWGEGEKSVYACTH